MDNGSVELLHCPHPEYTKHAGFTRKKSLADHMWKQHKVGDNVKCSHCEETFRSDRGKKLHETRSHKIITDHPTILVAKGKKSEWTREEEARFLLAINSEKPSLKSVVAAVGSKTEGQVQYHWKKHKERIELPDAPLVVRSDDPIPIDLETHRVEDLMMWSDLAQTSPIGPLPSQDRINMVTSNIPAFKHRVNWTKMTGADWNVINSDCSSQPNWCTKYLPGPDADRSPMTDAQWTSFQAELSQWLNGIHVALEKLHPRSLPTGEGVDLTPQSLNDPVGIPDGLYNEIAKLKDRIYDIDFTLKDCRLAGPIWKLRKRSWKKAKRLIKIFEDPKLHRILTGKLDENSWKFLRKRLQAIKETLQRRKRRVSRNISRAKKRKLRSRGAMLFRKSRGKFYRELEGQDLGSVQVPIEELHRFQAEKAVSENPVGMDTYPTPDWIYEVMNEVTEDERHRAEEFSWIFNLKDVQDAVTKSSRGKAAGPDEFPFELWKNCPALHPILLDVFNVVLHQGMIPDSWRDGVGCAIPKVPNPTLAKDVRLIILQRTIYKLFSACLTQRLLAFCAHSGQLSTDQRGFRPVNGCQANIFMMNAAVDDLLRRRSGAIFGMLFDVVNAFGSVEHEQLIWTMNRMLVPLFITRLIANLISNSYFTIRVLSALGVFTSPPVWQDKGLKQGDPLSAILFLFAMEPLVRVLKRRNYGYRLQSNKSVRVGVQHFADDLASETNSHDEMSQIILVLESFMKWAKMRLHPDKCVSFAMQFVKRKLEFFDPKFTVHGQVVPSIVTKKKEKYLGAIFDMAYDWTPLYEAVETKYRTRLARLGEAPITPHQKLIAIGEWIQPVIEYHFPNIIFELQFLRKLDRLTAQTVRSWFNLCGKSSTAHIFSPRKSRGLGLKSLEDRYHISKITHVSTLLQCPDREVRQVALQSIYDDAVAHRQQSTDDDLWLNELENEEESQAVRRTNWCVTREIMRDLGIIVCRNDDNYVLQPRADSHDWQVPHNRVSIRRWLTERCEAKWLNQWKECEEQGIIRLKNPTIGLIDPTFAKQYRQQLVNNITQKGYLSMLPTRSRLFKLRISRTDKCDRCHKFQTQCHIFNNCHPRMDLIRERHDNALSVLHKYIRKKLTSEESLVFDQHFPIHLLANHVRFDRPDIVVTNEAAHLTKISLPHEQGRWQNTRSSWRVIACGPGTNVNCMLSASALS
eukprot:TRINITY_DN6605_c0_g1_i2.p1 TRINITY_DN6605_c0_g1~~TRINITY_DN6605_c0_g1_i2.p1  ORF type:complete len:1195 (+),score=157.48 TRINITY_DN6605_c0_g1_i2:250-3834(+)